MKTSFMGMLLLVVVSLWAVPSQAEDRLTAFGFEIGKPLYLPECEFNPVLKYSGPQKKICMEPRGLTSSFVSVHFPSNERPSLLSTDAVSVKLFIGNLEALGFGTKGFESKETVLQTLEQKYGKPTRLIETKVQNRLGAKFDSFLATWEFADLYVEYEPIYMGSMTEGFIRIETPRAKRDREDTMRALTRDNRPL